MSRIKAKLGAVAIDPSNMLELKVISCIREVEVGNMVVNEILPEKTLEEQLKYKKEDMNVIQANNRQEDYSYNEMFEEDLEKRGNESIVSSNQERE